MSKKNRRHAADGTIAAPRHPAVPVPPVATAPQAPMRKSFIVPQPAATSGKLVRDPAGHEAGKLPVLTMDLQGGNGEAEVKEWHLDQDESSPSRDAPSLEEILPTRLNESCPDVSELPPFDPRELLRLYLEQRCREATVIILKTLKYHAKQNYTKLTPQLQAHIDTVVETVLYLMTRPDFAIDPDHVKPLVGFGFIMANLVALSSFRTTDPQLAVLEQQPRNFVKVLFLYSVRNKARIDPKILFDANPDVASLWYNSYALSSVATSSELLWENCRRHVGYADERLRALDDRITTLYFGATYVDPERDRFLKRQYNADIRRSIGTVPIRNKPSRDRIAIVTGKWYAGSAVYKSSFPLIRTLKDRYRLVLVHLGPPVNTVDRSLFEEVRGVRLNRNDLDCSSIAENDFQLVYFPDVGMMPESIWLSNMRIAPIQVVSYGHPVSTFGSEIDYFLGGTESEIASDAEENYSERLVLVPGIGAHPVFPDYQPKFPPPTDNVVRVNCSWGNTKITYPLLKLLVAVKKRASRSVNFQFFPGWGMNRYNAVLPFMRDISDLFGDAATVFANRVYDEYMEVMEKGSLSVDSFPFGGYNTIVDSLFLAKPTVTYEGRKFYNRAASALLYKVGLRELVARSDDEYIEKTLRLIEDETYRRSITEHLRKIDLRATLFDTDEPAYFRKAIDHLIDNHETLAHDGSRSPIFIR